MLGRCDMSGRMKTPLRAVCVAAALALAGCGGGNMVVNYEEPRGEITTLTFFGNKYEPENVAVIEEIITDFMAENPDIRVSYESLKGTDYYEALEKRMAAGKGDDVFMVNHDIVLEFKQSGQLMDLSGLESIDRYTDRMRSQMDMDGRIYWVPTIVSAFGLYCNMDLLEKHRQPVPENAGEWKQICAYFQEQGITPVIANNDISLKTLAIGRGFYPVYRENRQEEVFARLNSGEESLSSYLTDGFSLAEELVDLGYVDAKKALETKKTADDLEQFTAGESPFMLTGAWAAGRVEKMNPSFEFRVEPIPALEDGAFLVINADVRLSVNADSEHPEQAMRFVAYFTREENIRKLADEQSSFSPLKDGGSSSVKAIAPLIPCYEADRTVIGTDGLLELPIWSLTEQASKLLLTGDSLESVMIWMDQEAARERGAL